MKDKEFRMSRELSYDEAFVLMTTNPLYIFKEFYEPNNTIVPAAGWTSDQLFALVRHIVEKERYLLLQYLVEDLKFDVVNMYYLSRDCVDIERDREGIAKSPSICYFMASRAKLCFDRFLPFSREDSMKQIVIQGYKEPGVKAASPLQRYVEDHDPDYLSS